MRFDAEGSVGSAKKADMESGSESASDSGSREEVLVTELKHDAPVHEGWNPTLMNGKGPYIKDVRMRGGEGGT